MIILTSFSSRMLETFQFPLETIEIVADNSELKVSEGSEGQSVSADAITDAEHLLTSAIKGYSSLIRPPPYWSCSLHVAH